MLKIHFARLYLLILAIVFFILGVVTEWTVFAYEIRLTALKIGFPAVFKFSYLLFFVLGLLSLSAIYFAEKRESASLAKANSRLQKEIEERRRIETALKESEERYRTMAEFSLDCAYWQSPAGEILYVSPASLQVTGYTPDEIRACPELFSQIVHPEDQEVWERHVNQNPAGTTSSQLEFRIITKSGQVHWIGHTCRAVYDEKGNFLGRRGSHRDITQKKELENKILSHEKLQAAVETAGAVCHELNQPLMAVSGYAELLLMEAAEDAAIKQKARQIKEQVARMGKITQKLMNITRYKTRDYIQGHKIVDIDESAQSDPPRK